MKVFVAADVHLSNALPYAKQNSASMALEGTDRLRDICDAVLSAATIAYDEGARRTIFLGDLLDRRLIDGVTDYWAKSLLISLRRLGYTIDIIPGNHEAEDRQASAYSVSAYGIEIEGVRVLIDGPGDDTGIWPVAYRPESVVTPILGKIPDGFVPFIHQTVRGAHCGVWDSPSGIDPEVLSRFPWVVSGHFHTSQPLVAPANGLYLGATVQHHFGDANDERSCWLVDMSTHTAERIPTPAPKFKELKVRAKDDSWAVMQAFTETMKLIPGGYLSLKVSGEMSEISQFRNSAYPELEKQSKGILRFIEFSPDVTVEAKDRLETRGRIRSGEISWKAMVSRWVANNACNAHGVSQSKAFEMGERLITLAAQKVGEAP